MPLLKRIFTTLLLVLVPYAASAQTQGVESAYESVVKSTDLLLARLVEVQPIYETDPEGFFAEVEEALNPYIDFDGFAKRVMAKHYRRASPEQQASFRASFKQALIRTYATALLEFDNQKVEVLQPDGLAEASDRATVVLEVHSKSGAIYPVQYQLGLEGDRWLLRNVIINGINIGLQFRSQFSAYMQKHQGDIDKVIENWTVDVESRSESA